VIRSNVVKELILLLAMFLGNQWTVNEFALHYEVSPSLAACIVQHESNWDPDLISQADDTGLYQIIPDTAAWVAEKLGYVEYNMLDPVQNAEFGAYILKHYKEWFTTLPLCEGDYDK
jgi:soluble lytic murein transglycosylase-like protein